MGASNRLDRKNFSPLSILSFIVNTLEKNQNDSFQSGGSITAARDCISGRVFDFIGDVNKDPLVEDP